MCVRVNAWILYKIKHQMTDKHSHGENLYSVQDAIIKHLCVVDNEVADAFEPFLDPPMKCRSTFCPLIYIPPVLNGNFPTSIPNNTPRDRPSHCQICKWKGCGKKFSSFCRACEVSLCDRSANGGQFCFEKYHSISDQNTEKV